MLGGNIEIEVVGTLPVPRRVKRDPEKAWRRIVAGEARKVVGALPPMSPHADAAFSVTLEFRLLSWSTDLDNLAKPVLDTLFAAPENPNALEETGALLEADDSRIMSLLIEKTLVDSVDLAGVKIDISWMDLDQWLMARAEGKMRTS